MLFLRWFITGDIGNIFIAAPADIYVSGDLREELLNDAFLSPELGKY